MSAQNCWTVLNAPGAPIETVADCKKGLESDNVEVKYQAMQNLIQALMNGEKFPPNIIMTIIRHVLPTDDKRIKKLLLLFWDIVPKRHEGKLMEEMILVCDAYRKDLEHPNEYICGATLRFMSHLEEPELLGELISAIFSCLNRNQPYTRRNAVVAIAKIYTNFKQLVPDAPERIAEYLEQEKDDDCKRAALLALMHVDYKLAQKYMDSCLETIFRNTQQMQLLFVQLISTICTTNRDPEEIKKYIEILYSLISASSSRSVRYQAAATLMQLTRSPQAIKITATCFIDICTKESDNNVKLIALDSLINLRQTKGAERVLQGTMMDFLRILQSASDLEVRKKVLKLSLELVTSTNVREMTKMLQAQVVALHGTSRFGTIDETNKYRLLLVETLHQICMRFPEAFIECNLCDTMLLALSSSSDDSSSSTTSTCDEKTIIKVHNFFKVFMFKHAQYRGKILDRITTAFESLSLSSTSMQHLEISSYLWLMGEFSSARAQIERSYEAIKSSLGRMPLAQVESESNGDSADSSDSKRASDIPTVNLARQVTADGSYATQSAAIINAGPSSNQRGGDGSSSSGFKSPMPALRKHFLSNSFDVSSELAEALVKMASRYQETNQASNKEVNVFLAKCQLIIVSILNLHRSSLLDPTGEPLQIDNDRYEKLAMSLKVLMLIQSQGQSFEIGNDNDDGQSIVGKLLRSIYTKFKRSALQRMIENFENENMTSSLGSRGSLRTTQIGYDERINISMLEPKQDDLIVDVENLESLSSAGGQSLEEAFRPKISETIQLTGHTDPVYAECKFSVNQYDIGLDVLLKNQTEDTLQNLTLELNTRGDLTLVNNRNEPIVLAPLDFTEIHASVKVVSTENGRIFGSIVYDICGTSERDKMVVTNDICVNITDYIKPAICSDDEFRDMWRAFEWENKVNVSTQMTSLKDYLDHLITSLNMNCVSPPGTLTANSPETSRFLCANLYGKSYFGEDAIVNVSIEQESPRDVVTGHVKVRSLSQGMALSLGEKIASIQGGVKAA